VRGGEKERGQYCVGGGGRNAKPRCAIHDIVNLDEMNSYKEMLVVFSIAVQ
jgi:hypothetical protein